MNKEIIEKYLNNNCSEEELKRVLDWFANSAHLPEGKALLYNIWEEFDEQESGDKADYDTILCKIHHEINIRQSKVLINNSKNDLVRYSRRQYFITLIRNVAAILLLPVLGLGVYYSVKYYSAKSNQTSVNQAYNEVFSSVDAITKVTLPDGSSVWLNHSSSLRYPAAFQGRSRNVELKGEGYFEVTHNSKIPFIVKAGEIQIKAIGTTFNIMAYPDEDRIETSLINGLVELERTKPNGDVIPLLKMKPTDLSVFEKSNYEINTRTIDDDRYFSWKDGKLVFNAEPMVDVVKKLSRWFNVDIQIKDPELNGLTLTATFVHETLPQVLELLTFVSPVSYTISVRKTDPDSVTFSKRKVILSYRKI